MYDVCVRKGTMCVHVYGTIYSISTVEGSEGSVVHTGTCISNEISAFRLFLVFRVPGYV
jgi:hypothetical protein